MKRHPNELRIIGGKWRGRRLKFAHDPAIRPTTDFVRETLFNWLMPYIEDANCLDLFAGSGALGFEALSRGAKQVTMIDQSLKVIRALQEAAATLQTDAAKILCLTITPTTVLPCGEKFDVVFIDPPFKQDLVTPICNWLENSNYLTDAALIYIEKEKRRELPEVPSNWQLYREKTSGQVSYYLFQRKFK